MARPEKIRLGELLVQQALITEDQLKQALAEQKLSGRKLGRVLIDSKFVTEEGISQAMAKQLDIPYINLRSYNLKPAAVRMLSEAQARRFRALVLEERGNVIRVGFADPTDLFAYDEVSRALKRDIELTVVTESQLLETIDRVYQRTEEISGLAQELTAELGDVTVDLGAMGITPGLEEAPVVKLLQSVFEAAVQVRASDVHIEPQEKSLVIRFRVDGILHVQTQADIKIATALLLRLKLMSGLDISEKRLPQDGRFNVKVRNTMVDVRMSTMPTQYGEAAVMRLLNQSGGLLGLDRLGMPQRIVDRVREVIHHPSGMVLVTGPPAAARPPAVCRALRGEHPGKKIIPSRTRSNTPAGINQVQVNDKSTCLRPRAALGPAPGSGHRPRRRDARQDHRRDRPARRHDRPHGVLHPAHQRCRVDAGAPARHGRAALHGGAVAAPGAGAAAGARRLRPLRTDAQPDAA